MTPKYFKWSDLNGFQIYEILKYSPNGVSLVKLVISRYSGDKYRSNNNNPFPYKIENGEFSTGACIEYIYSLQKYIEDNFADFL